MDLYTIFAALDEMDLVAFVGSQPIRELQVTAESRRIVLDRGYDALRIVSVVPARHIGRCASLGRDRLHFLDCWLKIYLHADTVQHRL